MADRIQRTRPKDVPFDPAMPEALLDRLVSSTIFDHVKAKFRTSSRFRDILKVHARLVRFEEGDLIIREGDWGNSAFFVISGRVAVVPERPDRKMPPEVLGRQSMKRKGLFDTLGQFFNRRQPPERRDKSTYAHASQTASRSEGAATRIYLQDVPAILDKYAPTELQPGQLFGELAALGRCKRSATVFAIDDDVELLEVRWQGLRDIMRGDRTGFRESIHASFRELALKSFLEASPFFGHIRDDEDAMKELVEGVQLETYGELDQVQTFRQQAAEGVAANLKNEPLIAQEGNYPNGVYIIRSGVARVSQAHHHSHRTVSYLTPGQVFGFEEIAGGWWGSEAVPLKYSLRAIGYSTVVMIPTYLVEKQLMAKAHRDARLQKLRRDSDPLAALRMPGPGHIDPDFVEFLVQGHYVQGKATMLIDLDRCTRCDDCVRACASTHEGNPRFLRHGPTFGSIMVANACMHCQDPVCMIDCPTGAISRLVENKDGAVVINDRTCIGCGTCANNCPYDAIRMVEIRNAEDQFIRDAKTHQPIPKATKCDLCADQWGGPACQRACPHDALVRLDISGAGTLADWYTR